MQQSMVGNEHDRDIPPKGKDKWMDGWIDGWIDGWMAEGVGVHKEW